MRKTFTCNEQMIITVPVGGIVDAGEGELLPEKLHCVFKDSYKVFVLNGKPKPIGAAQTIAGVFIVSLGLLLRQTHIMVLSLPSVLFVVSGMLSYTAGKSPNMLVAKLSFSLNIISFFWSLASFALCLESLFSLSPDITAAKVSRGIIGLIMSLLVIENIVALFLIYWMSKAICRQNFNTLPIILLKHGD